MSETCSNCKKKISMWTASYVNDMVLCEDCYEKNKLGKLEIKKEISNKEQPRLEHNKEIVYCPYCKKDVILAKTNWEVWMIILFCSIPILALCYLFFKKDKCSICGQKIKED